MAINEERSYTEYNVEVPTTDFPIGFDILDDGIDVVAVTLNDVDPTTLGYTVTQVNSTTYRFAPAVPSGVVRLTRITDIDHMVHVFTEGAIFVSENMDSNFKQIRHSQQEVQDTFSSLEASTSARLGTFSDSVEALNTEFISTRDVVSDLVTISADTVNTANNALNTAIAIDAKASTALSNSSTALNTANSVDAKATDALDNSLTAVLDSSAALSIASGIDAKATQALTDSAEALSSATTALNTANAIDGKATQALTNSTGALKSSNNLSDVSSAAVSRTNLGVMSSSEVATAISNATPNATETTAGKAKIATTAIAQEGTNDTDIITSLKLKNTVFGLGQNRKAVAKISGTTYTNTTGKPVGFEVIFKSTGIDFSNMSSNITVNSEIRQNSVIIAGDTEYRCSMFVIILPNESYSFNAVRLSSIEKVTEIS